MTEHVHVLQRISADGADLEMWECQLPGCSHIIPPSVHRGEDGQLYFTFSRA